MSSIPNLEFLQLVDGQRNIVLELVKSGIRVPRDLHKRVKIEAAERTKKIETAYREALQMWLGEASTPTGQESATNITDIERTILDFIRATDINPSAARVRDLAVREAREWKKTRSQ